MTDNDPLIGRQLANFLIERVLGRGGMAQVYYGQDVKLQRPVAIKVIDARYRNKPSYAQRFVKEARSVANWRHENIIQIYYADDADDLYYYVMEYIGGHDLSSTMSAFTNRGELMPAKEILRIGRAVASALDYAHQQGIIHRDVKPSNVLMSEDGSRVVLGDFGLALDMQEGSSGEIFGTPHYISPEQARRSKDVVPQSDIYSLGVILYEMLTGVVPFDDISPTSVALQHCTQPPPPPRSINPLISIQTEQVILKALNKNPEERYQSGMELIEALEKALAAPAETQPQKILPLPPIPAAVLSAQAPTLFQSPGNIEINPPAAEAPATPPPPTQPIKEKKGGMFWPVVGLLALAGLLYFGAGLLYPGALPAILPVSASPTEQASAVVVASKTPSPLPPTVTPLPAATEMIALPTETPTLATAVKTATATSTATKTSDATNTSTAAAETVSPTPTASETVSAPELTGTATETATAEPTPSLTPTITVGGNPTVKYPNGKRFMIFYDPRGLYLMNVSDKSRPLEPFSFDRITDTGELLNHFDGWRWSQFYPTIYSQNCIKIEVKEQAEYPTRPAECENRYVGKRLYERGDKTALFWTPEEGSHFFKVSWLGEEVAQCEIARGVCEVFVP